MQESRVGSLGPEDHLEEEIATPSCILAWEILGQRGLVGYSPWSCKELYMTSDRTVRTKNGTSEPIYKTERVIDGENKLTKGEIRGEE